MANFFVLFTLRFGLSQVRTSSMHQYTVVLFSSWDVDWHLPTSPDSCTPVLGGLLAALQSRIANACHLRAVR